LYKYGKRLVLNIGLIAVSLLNLVYKLSLTPITRDFQPRLSEQQIGCLL